uniref:Uncharacterized protein n=1 Tax=Anopheles atroparvus TaxID=41427 RepID=A0AAG5DQQ7_ANOAO
MTQLFDDEHGTRHPIADLKSALSMNISHFPCQRQSFLLGLDTRQHIVHVMFMLNARSGSWIFVCKSCRVDFHDILGATRRARRAEGHDGNCEHTNLIVDVVAADPKKSLASLILGPHLHLEEHLPNVAHYRHLSFAEFLQYAD